MAYLMVHLLVGWLNISAWTCLCRRHNKDRLRRAQRQRRIAQSVIQTAQTWLMSDRDPDETVLWIGCNGWTPASDAETTALAKRRATPCCLGFLVPLGLIYTVPVIVWFGVGVPAYPGVGFWLGNVLPFGIVTLVTMLILLPIASCDSSFLTGVDEEFPTRLVYAATTKKLVSIAVSNLTEHAFDRDGNLRGGHALLQGQVTSFPLSDLCAPTMVGNQPRLQMIKVKSGFFSGVTWGPVYNGDGNAFEAFRVLRGLRIHVAEAGPLPQIDPNNPATGLQGIAERLAGVPAAVPGRAGAFAAGAAAPQSYGTAGATYHAPGYAPPAMPAGAGGYGHCGKCGAAVVDATDAFCRACGGSLRPAAVPAAGMSPAPSAPSDPYAPKTKPGAEEPGGDLPPATSDTGFV